jgi:hypothetical protein
MVVVNVEGAARHRLTITVRPSYPQSDPPVMAATLASGHAERAFESTRCRVVPGGKSDRILGAMSTEATEMVTIPRSELEALKAELRQLRLAAAREEALRRIKADPGPGPDDTARVFSREQLAEAWEMRA